MALALPFLAAGFAFGVGAVLTLASPIGAKSCSMLAGEMCVMVGKPSGSNERVPKPFPNIGSARNMMGQMYSGWWSEVFTQSNSAYQIFQILLSRWELIRFLRKFRRDFFKSDCENFLKNYLEMEWNQKTVVFLGLMAYCLLIPRKMIYLREQVSMVAYP